MNFILVHGSWLDSRCWAAVETALRRRGNTVQSVQLPGHGGSTTSRPEINLALYVETVLGAASQTSEPSVLVGHSMAGVVISQAAEQAPEQFSTLVYVAAYLPTSGQSLNDLAMSDADSRVGPNMVPAPDWSTLAIAEPARAELFFHDVEPSLSAAFLETWRAEPVAPLTVPLELSADRFGKVPKLYIRTLKDRVVSPSLQERMLAATPVPSVELDCGHLPMLVMPDALVTTLLEGVRA